MREKDQSEPKRGYTMLVNFSGGIITRRALAFTIAALMCCAGVAIAVRAYNRPADNSVLLIKDTKAANSTPPVKDTKAAIVAEAAPPKPALTQQKHIEVESILLTRFGFEPEQITRPQDEFLLFVENRSGVGDINLQLDKVAGNRIHQQYVSKEKLDWHEFVKLEPGEYVLTEANHPDWKCHIKITPR